MVTVGDREVRVSSPDRVVYEATDWAPEVTKLQVCEYFIGVAPAFMRASGDRPVALERWPGGWREGMTLSVDSIGRQTGTASTRSASPRVLPIGSRPAAYLTPNDRPIDELCLTEPAAAVWAAQMGTLTFHPWAVRSSDLDHPDELRLDLDPQPGATFADARRVAGVARELLEELGLRGYPKTSGNRGIHIYVRIRPEWTFDEVRHAAIGLGRELERRDDGVTTAWWKEERGEARSSWTSTRTFGTVRSRAPGRCGRGRVRRSVRR